MGTKATPVGTTIQNCVFTAEAGKCQSPAVAAAASRLADALVAQARAVSDLALVLKGTNNGVMQTGITVQG